MFDTLHHYDMKLNPNKCAFGVLLGKFLGFMVSQRGVKANPDKIRAILEMTPLIHRKKNLWPINTSKFLLDLGMKRYF